MRDFIQILKRFIPPYKSRLGKNIFYNILSAAFGSVSFVLLVPVLNILFNVTEEVTELVPFELNKESLMTNFNYYVTLSKQHFSASTPYYLPVVSSYWPHYSKRDSPISPPTRSCLSGMVSCGIFVGKYTKRYYHSPFLSFLKNARVTLSPVPRVTCKK